MSVIGQQQNWFTHATSDSIHSHSLTRLDAVTPSIEAASPFMHSQLLFIRLYHAPQTTLLHLMFSSQYPATTSVISLSASHLSHQTYLSFSPMAHRPFFPRVQTIAVLPTLQFCALPQFTLDPYTLYHTYSLNTLPPLLSCPLRWKHHYFLILVYYRHTMHTNDIYYLISNSII